MSDDDFVRRLRAMRDVPPWMTHLTFDAPLRVQRARRESSIGSPTVDEPELFPAEIVAQTNMKSLALAIRRELGEGYVIAPGVDMLYAIRRLRAALGEREHDRGRNSEVFQISERS